MRKRYNDGSGNGQSEVLHRVLYPNTHENGIFLKQRCCIAPTATQAMVEEFTCEALELECKRMSKAHMLAAYTAAMHTLPTNVTVISDLYKAFLKTNLGVVVTHYFSESNEHKDLV